MNKFMRLFALLLVAVAIVLVVLAFKYGGHEATPRTVTSAPPAHESSATVRKVTYPLVTAANTLEPGAPISADELKVEERPQRVAGSFASVDAVVGKIPAVRIAGGTVLTQRLMLDDLSLKLLPGERAMAVPVTETSGAGNHIHPGDYVDVFFSLKPATGQDSWEDTQARLLLPRLRVLAYGSRMLPEPAHAASSKSKKADDASRTFRASAAVLAVPVDKVNRLLLAEHNGKLSLLLRNPQDQGLPDTKLFPQPGPVLIAKAEGKRDAAANDPAGDPDNADNHAYAGIRLGDFASGNPAPKRRAPSHHRAPAQHRVDVIRGTQRSHITVYNHQGSTP